jgi:hypothetical protein
MNPTNRANDTTLTSSTNSPVQQTTTTTKQPSQPLTFKINRDTHLGITIRWGCRRPAAGTARPSGSDGDFGGSPC